MQYNQGRSKLTKSLDEIIKDQSTLPIEIHKTSIKNRISHPNENHKQAINTGWIPKMNCGKQLPHNDLNTNLLSRSFNRCGNSQADRKFAINTTTTDLRHFISSRRQCNRQRINNNSNRFRPYSNGSKRYSVYNAQPFSMKYRKRKQLQNGNIGQLNQVSMASVALSEAAALLHESFNGLSHLAKVILDSNAKLRSRVNSDNSFQLSKKFIEPAPCNQNYSVEPSDGNNNCHQRLDSSLNDYHSFYSQHPYYVNKRNMNKTIDDSGVLSTQIANNENVPTVLGNTRMNSASSPLKNIRPLQPPPTIGSSEVFVKKPLGCTQNGYGILLEHNSACQISVHDITDLLSPIGAITHIEKLDRSTMLVYFEKEQDAHYAVCQYNQKYLDGFPLSLALIKK